LFQDSDVFDLKFRREACLKTAPAVDCIPRVNRLVVKVVESD